MTYRFVWYKNGLYEHWYSRIRHIVKKGYGRSVLVEFENGEQCRTLLNALRRVV